MGVASIIHINVDVQEQSLKYSTFVLYCSPYGFIWLCQGSSRTAEDKEKEQRGEGEERDERTGGGPQGSAARALPSGPNLPASNRVRNGPDPASSTPASRVPQSGESGASAINGLFLKRGCDLSVLLFFSGNASPRAGRGAERERRVCLRLHRGAPANASPDLPLRHDQIRITPPQVLFAC